jgi:hypothetical protein
MPVQPNLPLHEEMEARLSPELVGKIMREVKRGLKGRFEYWGTTTTYSSTRQLTWDKFQRKIWISENAVEVVPEKWRTFSLSPPSPYLPMKFFYFLNDAPAYGQHGLKWTRVSEAPELPPHYYFVYTKSGKSCKMFPILYRDSGDGPIALMDPKDPTKFLNLFVKPSAEVLLLKPRTSFFLNGPTQWLVPLHV